jgi:RNA polymerase sigma factor (sigma-70 family)
MAGAIRDLDARSFAELVEPHRRELHAHCYRMLGSVHDADDALQEALVGAWKGIDGFEGRSSLRSWLFTIATNASLRVLDGRRRREPPEELPIEPYPDELLRYEDREGVELAYVAALQLLPPNQRAALLLRDVLGFSARETADVLDTSVASANSALQRARAKLGREGPARSQQEVLRALGDDRSRELVARFVDAWNRADVAAIVAMLREDVTFSMPPLPPLHGRDDVAAFLDVQVFRTTWRFEATRAAGQPAIAGHRRDRDEGPFELRALTVLTFEGELVAAMAAFLGAEVLERHR